MDTQTLLVWTVFNVFLLAMLAVDLFLVGRQERAISVRQSLAWTAVWVALGLAFTGLVHAWRGGETALEYLTGYLIEKSLSVDNIFVFLVIFRYFAVPREHQHRVLLWGILGALALRAVFIFAGVALLERFHWVVYVLGGFLILTGIRTAFETGERMDPEHNLGVRLARRLLPIAEGDPKGRFLRRTAAGWQPTRLFLVLVVVEGTDVIFALDSIPAILAITHDEFIVYSSNAFAILGLRALYFALAGLMERLRYLHYGLAAVLGFVGVKMTLEGVVEVPVGASFGVVATLLAASVAVSLWLAPADAASEGSAPAADDPPG